MDQRERTERALSALNAGDLDGLLEHVADDIVWHVGGNHPLSGTYRGKPAVADYYAKVREQTGGTLRVDVEDLLVDEERCGIFLRVTADRDDRKLDVTLAEAIEFDKDGRWVEYYAMANDQPAIDRFWE